MQRVSLQTTLTFTTLIIGIGVIGGSGYLLYSVIGLNGDTEFRMGLLVVGAIGVLMTLLFVLASGFSFLGLADSKQPLGLPDGSIRAMIALVLIMVFIIFGIYLFRMVGTGNLVYIGQVQTEADAMKFVDKDRIISWFYDEKEKKYSVYQNVNITQDGTRLAQQLLTTVGTLVVAISGFYFGSTATVSAVAASQARRSASTAAVNKLTPVQGIKDQTVDLQIDGSGFDSPKSVVLTHVGESIVATDILSNSTKITCKVTLTGSISDGWDLVVKNSDDGEARLPAAFSIQQA